MQMLLAALSRRMSCSRARIVITNARRPSRSVVIPTSRPGIWRTSASVEARIPRYGPPYCGRDAERLALAGRDVRSVCARRRQDGQRDRLDDRHEQRAGGVGERADLGHRLEQAEEVRLAGDRPRRPAARRRPAAARARRGPSCRRRPRRRPAGSRRARARRRSRSRIVCAVVRMDRPRHEDPLAAGRPAGHQRGLGGRRRAVVVRRRDDVEADQLGDQRLVLVDALERPLADLGLVRACRPCTTRRGAGSGRPRPASSGDRRRRPRNDARSVRLRARAPADGPPARARARGRAGRAGSPGGPRGCPRTARRRCRSRSPRASAPDRRRYAVRRASPVSPPRSARRRRPASSSSSSSRGVGDAEPDHPAVAVRIAVDQLRRAGQRLVRGGRPRRRAGRTGR